MSVATAGTDPAGKLTDVAYARIEEMIVTLQLPPGASVSETQLSRQLGIGRTPIREALQRLARENLVLIMPRRGVMVAPIDIRGQMRLLEVRRELERLVARCAARRASNDERARFAALASEFGAACEAHDDVRFMRADLAFNELCLATARNEFAAGAMRLMNGLSRRFWYHHSREAADLPETARRHAAIAAAIAAGDAEAAGAAVDALLDGIERFTKASVTAGM